ncbi:hypothetical protein DFJ58DRAFT_859119 [Suillus subalutaceus]|uniref:uncharacterized protein n=1 Tax=Suillus subalutaceus TaxID=48586 RepID=UPI001B861A98|nr:uncharacterized protein DFJ58DRAFT_859119 [Suillus subalutaceus]KAG1839808.1 hypothetical protein DFJ58DRAFT_859119 [Suillus subalutaceus]
MSPGTLLCQLCKKLKKEGLTDDEVAHLKGTLKQCFQCGICGMNISDPCGTCKRKGWCNISTLCITSSELTPVMVKLAAHDENGISDREAISSQARRCNAIEGRLHRPLSPSTPKSKLSNLQENNGKPGSVTIYVECCLSHKPGSVDRTLGTYCAPYAETMTFIADENAILTSSFQHDAVTGHPASVSVSDKITFQRTICTIDQDGNYMLTEQGTTEQGFLARNTLFLSAADRGKTKDVSLLIIKNQEYVAKKLFDVGKGRGQLAIQDACQFLTADLIWPKRKASTLQVSDGFIIKTYSDAGQVVNVEVELQTPISENIIPTHQPTSIYLVEPRRVSSAVLTYFETLGVRNCTDKQSATIMAFSHLSWRVLHAELSMDQWNAQSPHRIHYGVLELTKYGVGDKAEQCLRVPVVKDHWLLGYVPLPTRYSSSWVYLCYCVEYWLAIWKCRDVESKKKQRMTKKTNIKAQEERKGLIDIARRNASARFLQAMVARRTVLEECMDNGVNEEEEALAMRVDVASMD